MTQLVPLVRPICLTTALPVIHPTTNGKAVLPRTLSIAFLPALSPHSLMARFAKVSFLLS